MLHAQPDKQKLTSLLSLGAEDLRAAYLSMHSSDFKHKEPGSHWWFLTNTPPPQNPEDMCCSLMLLSAFPKDQKAVELDKNLLAKCPARSGVELFVKHFDVKKHGLPWFISSLPIEPGNILRSKIKGLTTEEVTDLITAVSTGDTSKVKYYLAERKIDPNISYGNHLLLDFATATKQTEIVKLLLDYDADPKRTDVYYGSVLEFAIFRYGSNKEIVQLLSAVNRRHIIPDEELATLLSKTIGEVDRKYDDQIEGMIKATEGRRMGSPLPEKKHEKWNWEQVYINIFGNEAEIPSIKSGNTKHDVLIRSLITLFLALDDPSYWDPYLKQISDRMDELWLTENDGRAMPKIKQEHLREWYIGSFKFFVPTVDYKKEFKTSGLLQRVIREIFAKHGINDPEEVEWLGYIDASYANKQLEKHTLIAENMKSFPGLLHGKRTHDLQRALIMLHLANNKKQLEYVDDKGVTQEIMIPEVLASLLEKDRWGRDTRFVKFLDQGNSHCKTVRNPPGWHSFLLNSDKFPTLTNVLLKSFLSHFIKSSEIFAMARGDDLNDPVGNQARFAKFGCHSKINVFMPKIIRVIIHHECVIQKRKSLHHGNYYTNAPFVVFNKKRQDASKLSSSPPAGKTPKKALSEE